MAYSDTDKNKIFDEICEYISEGDSVEKALTKSDTIKRSTFYEWLKEDIAISGDKSNKYARAMELRADALFEEIKEIAFNTEEGLVVKDTPNGVIEERGDMLGHRRLKVDALKWMISKMQPKKYGDKIDVTTDGEKVNTKQVFKIGGMEIEL